jgi:peptide/nickel transport system substrate-binding protein
VKPVTRADRQTSRRQIMWTPTNPGGYVDKYRIPKRSVLVAAVASLALLAAACGGSSDSSSEGSSGDGTSNESGGTSGSDTPTVGGEVSYGLEAETSGGWCLAEAQLAISGIQVARAIYDTLTVPDSKGDYSGSLAESLTPNADFTQWTVKLRPGITFHDGTPLDAQVVKNNLDAYRGTYPARSPLLFRFVFSNIADTAVVDPSTVLITTATPWPSLPAALFGSGRIGIMGQKQLDSAACDTELIGTGPFKLQDWKVNDRLETVKNPNYWQKDANGTQLPYLDKLTFRPYPDAGARVNALKSGEVNMLHTSGAEQIQELRDDRDNGDVNLVESSDFAEVSYGMLNTSKPPFDNKNARLAAAYALDRDAYNKVINLDMFEMASGPFGKGEIGYLEDAGYPEYDLAKAKEYAAKYQQETGLPLEFTLVSTSDPGVVKAAQFIQEQAQKAGAKVNLRQVDQASLINTALGGDWQALSWRNHPGGNPDGQYNWWKTGSPVNFGKFSDPKIDQLLDQGRAEPDKEKATATYEDINRQFGSEVYNIWLNWTQWDIASDPTVSGVFGPNNPDGSEPFPGLATGHPVLGLNVQN